MRGDHDHVEVVDLAELRGLGLGRACHAGELVVEAEVVLEGDGGQGLVFPFDLDAFLGLDGLVQPVAPAPARHEPARELVHDHDLAVLHNVVNIALKKGMGLQRLVHVVHQVHVLGIVEIARVQELFDLDIALFGQGSGLGLLLDGVVNVHFEAGDDAVDLVVFVRGLLGGAGDDQRRPRLVDQDGVHLVNDGEIQLPLRVLRQIELHVVAQVVEAELVVRAVGDV